ncbi:MULTISPECIES: rhomboid family intramembrane serine protease [Sphingopyxis]|jgi:membrane associated rhomboid family serine protease|uniref:rhomboid family intramembrane serine protease n=1 Tax=Sphingopyxis TaxID=165697 RepID=UPI000835DF59|nr:MULTISPECIES: rhomboid family intramembrane serine protease [Sphingopyxis]APW73283.1 rhomboid family intramembrane serine protease [Sphingopyxis granuli]AVA14311.1 rhomboid family intramembrane serine protease [Sphingopyxis sp. MG]ODU24612.1 MAG: rhomboid family intramembrane serine protease [Sphingopyxis sp. SCN 67-31]QUM73807.1 rhomboid family intramembrane serine protease [Sphingopyxis granuli]
MKPQDAPLVTGYALLCAALFVVLTLSGFQTEAIVRAGFVPARWSGELILPPGPFVPFVLTPLTSAFLHGSLLHLIFNLVVLLYIGRPLEAPMGTKAIAVLLVVGACAGAFAQWLSNPTSVVPMIGASGAISALIAVFALIFSRSQAPALGPIPSHWVRALWLAAAWIGVQLLIGFAGGAGFGAIAIWAHVGGFLAGLLLARPLLRWRFGGR